MPEGGCLLTKALSFNVIYTLSNKQEARLSCSMLEHFRYLDPEKKVHMTRTKNESNLDRKKHHLLYSPNHQHSFQDDYA